MKTNPFKLVPLSLFVATTLQAHAATPPGISEAVQQAKPLQPAVTTAPPPSVEGVVPAAPPLLSVPGGSAEVTVSSFRFVGNAVIDEAKLQALVSDATGKSLSVGDLQNVATRITRLYRDSGFFVARAYVPAQEIVSGVVVINVIEGHYGDFILDHQGRLRKQTAQDILDAVKARDIVSVDTLERAMLVLNDTPGVHVTKVSVSPGQKVGTSDFNIATEATPAFTGVLAADNYGSVYTGKDRLSFSGAWDAPTETGDRLEVFAMTTNHRGLDSGRLGYWRLLTATGLRGEVAISHTTYSLGNTYANLDAVGRATTGEAQLTYPFILTETHRLTGHLRTSYNELVDEVRSTSTRTPKKVEDLNGGLEYSSVNPGRAMQAGATLTVGHLGFRDAVASAQDSAGADASGTFAKLSAHLERRQAVFGQFEVSVRGRAQVALNKSLDGSQKLEVSGSDGVIVYAPGELLGDTAVVGRIALSRSFNASEGWTISPNVFVDQAWAHNRFAVAGTPSSRSLGDVGVGLAVAYKAVVLSVQFAARTSGGKALAEPTSRSRALLQLIAAI